MEGTLYLVLLTCTHEDWPVYVTDCREKALQWAKLASWKPTPSTDRLFNMDRSTPVCYKVATFQNGLPLRLDIIRTYDEDDCDDDDYDEDKHSPL